MRGYHIYTRSWFEFGSKSKNAGTFTVELTPNLLGDKADEVIYNRINPMCATVPEALAPRNTDRSVLRMYHLSPDTTVICRSWFVTDKITDRGTVPYSFSLIFRGGDNDVFLRFPAKAFSVDAAEPYDSFCDRVLPDAPTELSTAYDPKREDYSKPFSFTREQWTETWGVDKALFAKYFSSVCEAVCSKQVARVGVILPEGKDGETLILATMSLMPMFMRRKLGAASSWTGMMDGSNSNNALNGIQLLCYHDESPVSDSKFPVIDLTGGGKHENLNIKCGDYAEWVWSNMDNAGRLAALEEFFNEHFSAVLDKMPIEVVQNCFLLWFFFVDQKRTVTFDMAAILIRLIADNFAKSFAKYPFISTHLKICLEIVLKGIKENPQADIKGVKDIQAVCLLAGNGEETARELVFAMYTHFRARSDWKKVSPPLMYYAGLLSRPNIPVQTENRCVGVLLENMKSEDPSCAKITQEALAEYLIRVKAVILRDSVRSDEAFSTYKDVGFALFTATNGKLPAALFKCPELSGTANPGRFAELMTFEVNQLGFVPGVQHWLDTAKWASRMNDDSIIALYSVYYGRLSGKNGKYILAMEQQPALFEKLKDTVFCEDATMTFAALFNEEWSAEERSPDDNGTWTFVKGWRQRLALLGYEAGDKVFAEIRGAVGLNVVNLPRVALSVSQDAILTMNGLYSSDSQLGPLLETLKMLDSEAASQNGNFQSIAANVIQSDIREVCVNRMTYWCRQSPSVERALTVSILRNPHELNVEAFLNLCRPNRAEGRYVAADLSNMLTALKLASVNSEMTAFRSITGTIGDNILTNQDYERLFADSDVKKAFKEYALSQPRQQLGEQIYSYLKNGKKTDDNTLYNYVAKQSYSSANRADALPAYLLIAAILGAVFTIASVLLIFVAGNGFAVTVLEGAILAWLPYVLALIILVFSGINFFVYRPAGK